MTKIMKIAGTNVELEIESCDSRYQEGGPDTPGCPCFFDGQGYEYTARCNLTGQDGDRCDESGSEPIEILSKCPLPDKAGVEKR